ncbi:hypothetical protein GCM10009733_032990 [Nonomuraea maheshkhaliensis]|uniref:Tyr recombinase domain-containing protein n=1 Tax=Nonomuraea maheshkhaliensis TaxID=419590 RepID=A0ABN2F8W5_9ACTN
MRRLGNPGRARSVGTAGRRAVPGPVSRRRPGPAPRPHGLRWADVDLEASKLEVVQSLQRVAGRLQFVRPKTSDSERTVPLPPICVEALREHRRKQFAERSDRWEEWTEHGLVFPSRCGTPMEPDNLRRSWGAIRKAVASVR